MTELMPPKFLRTLPALALIAVLAWPAGAVSEKADADRYRGHVKVLAADRMEGRGAETKGLARAGRYIEREFQRLGLKPMGENGTYEQSFLVTTGARLRPQNSLVVTRNGARHQLKLREDYIPLSFSSVGSVSGPLAFVGYGASAEEFGYDDYTHFDVKDKVVVVLRREPPAFHEKSGRQGPTHHAHLITKAINARNRGAKAVILVNGNLGKGEQDLLLRFERLAGPEDVGIPIVQVKNAVADSWLEAAGASLSQLQREIDEKSEPRSRSLPDSLQVSLRVEIEKLRSRVHNVLAYLPGKSEEYVVLGAHYDHLGRGGANSLAPSQTGQIHHGADDNASGTAGLLELARVFSVERGKLERGILFAAFAGEELGLLGSAHWVKHPTLPLDKAVAMLNMDMIGRIRDGKVYVGGVGTGSNLRPLVEAALRRHRLTVDYSSSGYAASDHTSFITQRIPALFFFSGLHSDYHKPSDTWEKIDAPAAANLLDLVADITEQLAAAERPQFVKVEAETRGAGSPSASGGYGPYFGSIPDFGEVETGVRFADVRPGSPAAKAGLLPGDILIQFGETPVKNLYDFTYALRRSKVGDVVEVKVLRGGQTVSARVTLEQRR
ncbi:MAG TPA: M20/M25/M40 family metallo-hydrolase [Terriglobales bacterium]|nr:M20/M25/M40 family metallo-hydrolase [Terriglobales bacterium]